MCLAKTQNSATKWEQRDAIWTQLPKTSLPLTGTLSHSAISGSSFSSSNSSGVDISRPCFDRNLHGYCWVRVLDRSSTHLDSNLQGHPGMGSFTHFIPQACLLNVMSKQYTCFLQNLSKPLSHSFCLHGNYLHRSLGANTVQAQPGHILKNNPVKRIFLKNHMKL